MAIDVPEPVAAYAAPKTRRTRMRFRCFTEDALSTTRADYRVGSIRQWNKRWTRNTDTLKRQRSSMETA